MSPNGEPLTAHQLVGATADITTRHKGAYIAALIYGHHAGRLVVRRADEWVQIDAADILAGHTDDDIPLADRRTVRVCDRGTSRSYEGVTVRALTLVWACPACGEPRGEPRDSRVIEDGEHYHVHVWDNPCGHVDYYAGCLVEAGVRAVQPVKA